MLLHENSCNYNSYILSYKVTFIPFALLQEPKIRIKFSANWWSGCEKYFCFLLIASLALFQMDAEFNRLL